MPFYEYECEACGHYHEAMQKMTDKPLSTCPACGKARLVRLVSAPQFRLKGAGWYETDFKGEKDRKRNLADQAEPAAKPDEAAEGKPRVKPPRLAKAAKRKAARPKAAARKKATRKQVARKGGQKVAKNKVAKKKTPKQATRKNPPGKRAARPK
jgi:putative FmdB family regulatory protein